MFDQRGYPRRWAFKDATLESACNGHIPCRVRDLSETGARIQLVTSYILPTKIHLEIGSARVKWSAHVRWQIGQEAGVEFIDAIGLAREALPFAHSMDGRS